MSSGYDGVQPMSWSEDALVLLDQRLLPHRVEHIRLTDAAQVAQAITDMVVRGAPAIGITAAYGVALAARDRYADSAQRWRKALEQDLNLLAAARPTAVNLSWAIERMRDLLPAIDGEPFPVLVEEARRIHEQDIAANQRMGALGADLIEGPCNVLTHCNAGALATGGYGTALGVIRSAHEQGRVQSVFAGETRPWLQGARLTAWELIQDGIPVCLLADGATSYAMAEGQVRWVVVGADRIAGNGDVINKIGTYGLAISARHHGVGFMVAAPTSTVDMALSRGADCPIESRDEAEILSFGERRVAAEGAQAWNPVFDVTPAALVDAIVTELGVVLAPDAAKMAALMKTDFPA